MNEMLLSQLQRVMDEAVQNKELAGINLLIMKRGKEALHATAGFADLEQKKPVAMDSIFRLYSMTKPITGAAVMLLMERGLLDLATPVSYYFPSYQNQTVFDADGCLVPVRRSMTVRDLLSMTSGLPYNGSDPAGAQAQTVFEEMIQRLDGSNPMTTLEFASRAGANSLAFHPGEHFRYGSSADVLGALIETVSGMRFGDFLKKEFFEPLHMEDTGFYVPTDRQNRLVKAYETVNGELSEFVTYHLGIAYPMTSSPAFESGGAGLASTLPDYARFASMLLQNGSYEGRQILKPATVSYFTNGELLPWQQQDLELGWDTLTGYSYGNLMRCMKHPSQSVMLGTLGEYGWDGWLGAYFSNHPAEQLTILMGIQKKDYGTGKVTRRLRNLLLSDPELSSRVS